MGDSNFEATFPCDSEIEEEETEDEIQEKIKDVLYACSICSRAYISDLGFHSHMKNKHQIPNADGKNKTKIKGKLCAQFTFIFRMHETVSETKMSINS